jgi:hypothetical protein
MSLIHRLRVITRRFTKFLVGEVTPMEVL